ncbi:MAG: HEAT repeat domain-containing protein [Gemmataceae bacterium]
MAAHAFKKIGPAAVKAVPALVEGLADADAEIRRVAAAALAGIGPAAHKAVPALTRLVSDGDIDVRWTACHALGATGPKARGVRLNEGVDEHPPGCPRGRPARHSAGATEGVIAVQGFPSGK